MASLKGITEGGAQQRRINYRHAENRSVLGIMSIVMNFNSWLRPDLAV